VNARVVVTGVGVVSAAGVTRDDFYAALAAGTSGITVDEKLGPVARVGDFRIKEHVEPRALRRLARLAQMGLVAAKQALAQAGDLAAPRERIGIVLGTGLGTLHETIEFLTGCHRDGPGSGSPALFPQSVMNAAAGQMALELGLRGPNTTVNHREASALGALAAAIDALELGRADALLVGGLDEWNPEAHHGYRRLGGISHTGLRPYARGRDGTVLGEGAAVLLLEREGDAARRGGRPLARIAGLGAAGDPRARIGWSEAAGAGDGDGAARAITQALADADCPPGAVDWVCGGGLGLAVDALEARAVEQAVTRPAGRAVPHGSIAGQTGALLAGDALRLAAAIYAIERQALPGTVGAGDPDPDAPVPSLCRAPRSAKVDRVLIPTIAQGGANLALVLARP
jgi:3-oxoacyl-[acyl-carrier-protein] synthase II